MKIHNSSEKVKKFLIISQMSSNVSLDFIDRLRKAQNQLYREDAMNEIESVSVESQVKVIINLFNQSRINQKEYFFQMSRVFSPTALSDSLCSLSTINDPGLISPSPVPSQPILRILRFVSAFQMVEPSRSEKNDIDDKKRFYTDLLTFSIIPSYFNFFWTEYSIKSLFKFFMYLRNQGNNEIYDSLARVGFSTPFFIRFAQQSFQSVFNELLSAPNLKNIKKKNLVDKIRCNIKKYQHFIPDETIVVLACSSDPLRTLINSFFNIAFSSPIAAQTLGFFHYACRPSRDVLSFLKTVFDTKHHDSYVKNVMDAIINCDTTSEDGKTQISRYKELQNMYSNLFKDTKDFNENLDEEEEFKLYQSKVGTSATSSLESLIPNNSKFSRKSSRIEQLDFNQKEEVTFETVEPIPNKFNLFNISDVYYAQEIFQTKFLSSIDIALIKLISGKVSAFTKPEKIEYFSDSKVRQQKFSKIKTDEKTVFNQAILIAPMVRHLLQRADLIPVFKEAPKGLSLHDFLYTFLVKRGSSAYFAERMMNFNQMMVFFPNGNIKERIVKEALSSTLFTRMKKIKALSTFASIELKICRLNDNSQQQITTVQIVKEVNKMSSQLKLSKTISSYIKSPNIFVSEYKSDSQKCSEPDFSSIKYHQKVLFTVLSEKIDLATFSSQRESLKKFPVSLKEYDKRFSSQASNLLLRFVKEYFPPKKKISENEFNKNEYIAKKIMKVVVERKDIQENLIEAFNEHSLMRKLDLFSIALTNFQMFLEIDYPPSKGKLGSDEFTPAFAALILLCNPPMAVTNYAYLNDMTTGDLPTTEIFGGYASTIPIYLRVAIEYVIPELANNPPFLLEEEI